MNKAMVIFSAIVFSCGLLVLTSVQAEDDHPMGFFITSENIGRGADLGGLAGADAHCQSLATAVGAGDRN